MEHKEVSKTDGKLCRFIIAEWRFGTQKAVPYQNCFKMFYYNSLYTQSLELADTNLFLL